MTALSLADLNFRNKLLLPSKEPSERFLEIEAKSQILPQPSLEPKSSDVDQGLEPMT